jgi:hypothetical protein
LPQAALDEAWPILLEIAGGLEIFGGDHPQVVGCHGI